MNPIRLNKLGSAFVRVLIVILVLLIGAGLYLGLNPAALQDLILGFPIPGSVRIPPPGPTPPPPVPLPPAGPLPQGHQAYYGVYAGGTISCGFLLQLDDGRQVGVTAAHASPPGLPASEASAGLEFHDPGGALVARLSGPIGRGAAFIHDQFSMDYVLWSLAEPANPQRFLQPDPRGQAQPGEPVLVYSPAEARTWPGVVMSSSASATWIQLDASFPPGGFSGCPVISRVTGRLVGMAVAGADQPPVVMGLHPVGSLVEKARAAFTSP